MSDQSSDQQQDARAYRARAIATLRKYLPTDKTTELVEFSSISDGQLQEIVQLADGLLGVVVIQLRHDELYHAEGPPRPFVGLEGHVLAKAAKAMLPAIRASDVAMRLGPLKMAVVLLGAGSLEARAQAGRVRPLVADSGFEAQGYRVRWRGHVGMATTQVVPPIHNPRGLLLGLFEAAK